MLSWGDAPEAATVNYSALELTVRVSGLEHHFRSGDEAVHGTRVTCTNTPEYGITTELAFNRR